MGGREELVNVQAFSLKLLSVGSDSKTLCVVAIVYVKYMETLVRLSLSFGLLKLFNSISTYLVSWQMALDLYLPFHNKER